jgi:large subunit ribosomal protein L13
MNHTIDATNKSLGRLASEIAILLMGKNNAVFARNIVSANTVTVTNASKMKIAAPRMTEKTYKRFSGYPGGLREETMAHTIAKKGYQEILTLAVKGMLPDNKLKKEMLKHLTVSE